MATPSTPGARPQPPPGGTRAAAGLMSSRCCSLQVLATWLLFLQLGPALPSLFWEGHPEPIGRCSLEPNTSRVRPKREKKGKGDFAERGLPASWGPSQSARGGKPGSQGGRCWWGAGERGCPPLALLLCGATVPFDSRCSFFELRKQRGLVAAEGSAGVSSRSWPPRARSPR